MKLLHGTLGLLAVLGLLSGCARACGGLSSDGDTSADDDDEPKKKKSKGKSKNRDEDEDDSQHF